MQPRSDRRRRPRQLEAREEERDLRARRRRRIGAVHRVLLDVGAELAADRPPGGLLRVRSEEHTSELQSHHDLVCRLLLEKKKTNLHRDRQTADAESTNTTPSDTTREPCQ